MTTRERTIIGTVAKTPMRDLARGRLSGRLDLRRAAREAELPTPLADVVVHVAKKTRLNRLEKSDVARELAAHFRDGLDAGRPPDELVREFGDADAAAKLIRRGKKRSRNLAHKVWVRGWKAIGLTVLIMVTLYTLHAVRFHMGSPTVSTDYLAKINAPAKAVPVDDRAWPLYERAIEAYEEQGDDLDLASTRPGDERWGELVAHVRANRETLELLREAAAKPEMGYVVEIRNTSLGKLAGSLLDAQLPKLGEMREVVHLLSADARLSIERGDGVRATENLLVIARMAEHVWYPPTLISQLVSYAILAQGIELAMEILHERPETLARDAWASIAHGYAGYRGGGRVVIDFSHERYFFYDMLQRVYTDDGSGDGRLTPNAYDELAASSVPVNAVNSRALDAIVGPAIDIVAASREDMREEYDRVLDYSQRLARQTPWSRDAEAYGQEIDANFNDPIYKVRYQLMYILLPALSRTISSADELTMRRDALLVVIAIELYKRDTGALPESLDELVPDYLPSVPRDIADGQPIRYRQTGDGSYTLYSIGGDMDDDGGVPALSRGYRFNGPAYESTDGDWVLYPPEEH